MLILLTLIITWIAHNWWKLLLLLIGVIVLHEYQVRKHSGDNDKKEKGAEEKQEETIQEDHLP